MSASRSLRRLAQEHTLPAAGAPATASGPAQGSDFQSAQRELMARGYVQFHPILAGALGGFKPALMLGHALYWTRSWLADHPERDGWFWKTSTEWRDAIGLTQREQEGARTALRDAQVWSEQIAGSPARLFFRVDLAGLGAMLANLAGSGPNDSAAADPASPPAWLQIAPLLGRPVFFFRPLADMTGGVAPGLVLSQLLAEYRQALNASQVDAHGFFATGVEEARIALGLGTKVQRNARDVLKRAGLVQEAWTQEQRPRLMVRINMQAILACLSGQATASKRRARRAPQRGAVAAIEPVPVQQSLLPVPDRASVQSRSGNVTQVARLLTVAPGSVRRAARVPQDEPGVTVVNGALRHGPAPKAEAQQALTDAKGCPFVEAENKGGPFVETDSEGCPFVEPRVALLSNLYTKRINQRTTTARARDGDRPVDNSGCGRSRDEDQEGQEEGLSSEGLQKAASGAACEPVAPVAAPTLVLPSKLDAALHASALKVVERAPQGTRQQLLDELAGHMASTRKSIENPVGWLHGLTTRAIAGSAVFTLADGVAAARRARAEHEARLAAVAQPAPAEARGPQQASEAAVAGRARLKALLNEMRGAKSGAVSTPSPSEGES